MAISDLTGTSWRFDRTTLPYTSAGTEYQIDGKIITANHEYNLSGRMGTSSNGLIYAPLNSAGNFAWVGYNVTVDQDSFTDDWQVYDHEDREPLEEALDGFDMAISGGSDVTNATLIAWLEANATLIPSTPQLTVDMSTLTGWDALSSGSHSVQIVAKATGYRDSDPSTAVSFTKAPSGYNVRLQGIADRAGGVYFRDGQNDSSPILLRTTDNFDETVLCTSGYIYAYVCRSGGGSLGTASGGVSVVSALSLEDTIYSVTADGSITGVVSYGCFVEGTEITLADGSTKKIEYITFDDDLLVYDFYEGKFSTAKPQWISEAKTMDNYLRVSFDNGSELKVIGPGGDIGYHRIFNVEAQSFTHTGTQECQVGTTAFTDKGEFTKIVSQEVVKEDVRFFNVITDKHYNLFANGILTSCKLSNKYEIKDMKYTEKELMTEEEVDQYIGALKSKGFRTRKV